MGDRKQVRRQLVAYRRKGEAGMPGRPPSGMGVRVRRAFRFQKALRKSSELEEYTSRRWAHRDGTPYFLGAEGSVIQSTPTTSRIVADSEEREVASS